MKHPTSQLLFSVFQLPDMRQETNKFVAYGKFNLKNRGVFIVIQSNVCIFVLKKYKYDTRRNSTKLPA